VAGVRIVTASAVSAAHIATVRDALYGIENNYADPRLHAFVQQYLDEAHSELGALAARIEEAQAALREIESIQPKVLGYIRSNGFVFDGIGTEPGNWHHLAFSVYIDLCEADAIARAALADGAKERV
jgi:hypothetical protein